jgi:hypothetical protein
MPGAIVVTFEPTIKELTKSTLLALGHLPTKLVPLIVRMAVVGAILVFGFGRLFHLDTVWYLLSPLVWLIVGIAASWASIESKLRKDPLATSKLTMRFDEESVVISGEGVDSKLDWKLFKRFVSMKRGFLLILHSDSFYLIPRTAFKTEDEVGRWVHLVESKI